MKPVLLGTAQWGLDYGITNSLGQLSQTNIQEIADAASRQGIDFLDTSPAYGSAETRISRLTSPLRIQTKFSAASGVGPALSLAASAQACGSDPERLLVHDWSALNFEARRHAARELEAIRDSGLVTAVGVSAYTESDISDALEVFTTLDLIQAPASVLDQRLVDSTVIAEARDGGTLVQVRSIFLQGVLVAHNSNFSEHPDVRRFKAASEALGVSQLELAVQFINQQEWVDEVTFGVTSERQLDEMMAAVEVSRGEIDMGSLGSKDPALLDPRSWKP